MASIASEALWACFPQHTTVLSPTQMKIEEFGRFQKGWHYGEGLPFKRETLDKAVALSQEAARLGFFQTDAFPGLEGEVMVTIYAGDHYLEFIVAASGTVGFRREYRDQCLQEVEGLTLEQAMTAIEAFRMEAWNGSASSASATTINASAGSSGLPSKTLATPPEYPLSVGIVFIGGGRAFADTFETTTRPLPMSHRSSGASRPKHYLQAAG